MAYEPLSYTFAAAALAPASLLRSVFSSVRERERETGAERLVLRSPRLGCGVDRARRSVRVSSRDDIIIRGAFASIMRCSIVDTGAL